MDLEGAEETGGGGGGGEAAEWRMCWRRRLRLCLPLFCWVLSPSRRFDLILIFADFQRLLRLFLLFFSSIQGEGEQQGQGMRVVPFVPDVGRQDM